MSRSVSVPNDCAAVCYRELYTYNEDVWEDPQEQYDLLMEDIVDRCKEHWQSLYREDRWFDREDRCLLANDHCYIGLSVYDSMAAIWLKPREGNFAKRWCMSIAPKFNEMFGCLRKIGTFSNGESVYERIAQ